MKIEARDKCFSFSVNDTLCEISTPTSAPPRPPHPPPGHRVSEGSGYQDAELAFPSWVLNSIRTLSKVAWGEGRSESPDGSASTTNYDVCDPRLWFLIYKSWVCTFGLMNK